ncbi:hypothetical protein DH2020_021608 [Rehmannia glutinosa]|uniref:Exonuclease domain-containing protein n=1 Tax=Rehmannia glutinosa TaxID=99300 RepID=A0ABR0WAY1_REHGL
MFPQTYAYDHHYQSQDFEYFVVMDFEATCDKDRPPFPQEIIEFPSVIVSSATGQLEACFQTYVRPTCNRILTDFCKDLTGIQQVQVDRGVTLNEALLSHDQWLEKSGIKNTNFAVVTWSDWDCGVMLESECHYKNIQKPPYFNRRSRRPASPGKAAFTVVWTRKNTARLLALIMQRGFKISITTAQCLYRLDATKTSFGSIATSSEALRSAIFTRSMLLLWGEKRHRNDYKTGTDARSMFLDVETDRCIGSRCGYFDWASS